jgi:hypothetical protein
MAKPGGSPGVSIPFSPRLVHRSEKDWPAIKSALRRNVDVALIRFRNGDRAASA